MKDWKNKQVVVVGLARSGLAACELLLDAGARVCANDQRPAEALDDAVSRLEKAGAVLELGSHPLSLLDGTDLVVVSPGVPANLELLTEARRRNIEVIGELELAWRARPRDTRIIAVTGSNGKSTTVTLTGHLLTTAGVETWVGGNLGTPLSRLALEGTTPECAVVEVSSFQLEWAPTFTPDIAAILNVSANHLDRHASLEEYASLKGRIWASQRSDDWAVYNRDDDLSRRLAQSAPGRTASFGSSQIPDENGARFDTESVTVQLGDRSSTFSLADFPAPGAHNRENAAAALLMARLAGADATDFAEGLATFQPLPHRLELVGRSDGIRFYNDSKATTVTALARSLSVFDEPVVLITGGRDKGGDWAALAKHVRKNVKRAVVIGEATPIIMSAWEGCTDLQQASSLEAAFDLAREVAQGSDVVLFSPGCSSFDMFANFEARGHAFRALAQQAQTEGAA